ncbi:MAG: serine/threonine-protein phosphatase, partial [Nitrospiraceae bacterium]|nr:serine/threonine-protein phosphatase [Nitrospiraceae bacterium]
PGLAVAAMEDAVYQCSRFTLQPGDTLFLYTDGVTEATSVAGELFSFPRLITALSGKQHMALTSFIAEIKQDIAFFAKDAPQSDDITMLALRYQGTSSSGGTMS